MSELPPELQVGPFEYVTIKQLRDEGLSESDVPDPRARQLIQDAGMIITQVTGCVFVPVSTTLRIDGHGSGMIYLPGFIPIAKVRRISFKYSSIGDTVDVPQTHWVLKGRWIESSSPSASGYRNRLTEQRMWQQQYLQGFEFPELPNGIEVDGVFGNFERFRETALVLTAAADVGDMSITVVDTLDIRVNDVITVDLQTRKIVTAVDKALKTIDFEGQPLEAALTSAATVMVYGSINGMLQRAAKLIVLAKRYPLGSDQYVAAQRQDYVTSESTDGYSYSLAGGGPHGSTGEGYASSLTGSAEADTILDKFMPPQMALAV